ncbi:MAG: AzlC family ABC transporter permease [Microthrixaceae bacterium]
MRGLSQDSQAAFRAGVRRAFVLALGVLPFGAVYGVAVAQSAENDLVGASSSVLIFAGAAQLSLLELNDSGAAAIVAIGTALAINARFMLYSAALAPAFSEFPSRWRITLPHLMTDQAATLSVIEYGSDHDPVRRRWFYLGAAAVLFVFWQAGTAVGVLAGAQVPDGLQLEFIIPLMFTALAVPTLTHRPAVVAALVSVVVTVVSASAGGLPPGTNILAGGVAGVAVGAVFVNTDQPAKPAAEGST